MPEEIQKKPTTFDFTLKAVLGFALIATAAYIVSNIRKKAESDKRIGRTEAMLEALEKELQGKSA